MYSTKQADHSQKVGCTEGTSSCWPDIVVTKALFIAADFISKAALEGANSLKMAYHP